MCVRWIRPGRTASILQDSIHTFIVNAEAFLAFLRGKRSELRSGLITVRGVSYARKPLSGIDYVVVRLGYACKGAGCALLFECSGHGVLEQGCVSAGATFAKGDHITHLGPCVEWSNIYRFVETKAGKAAGATKADIYGFLSAVSV